MMPLGFSSEDCLFILHLLSEEMERKEGTTIGYASDPQIGRLQVAFSIGLQVAKSAGR